MKVEIDMGMTAIPGAIPGPALVDIEELLATRLLVQGNSGSGKSYLLRRLLEQSAPWVQQCIIDPEGDFVTLADEYGHIVVDGERSEAELVEIANRVRQHRASVVLTLEKLDAEQQMRAAAAFLNGLFDADRDYWFPMLIVVDEAQLFAPAVGGEVSDEARKLSLGAMTNLMCRGRKRGLAGVIATQRLAKLAKNVAAEASNFLMGRTFLDIDMARAADLLGMDKRQAEMFRDLPRGTFVALGPAMSRKPLPIKIGEVVTSARSTSPKLMAMPEQSQEAVKDIILAPVEPVMRAAMPRRAPIVPIPSANELLAQVVKARGPGEIASQPDNGMSDEDRSVAHDEILREIMSEPGADFRQIPQLYQDFLVRCRIKRIGGEAMSLTSFRKRLTMARAGVAPGDGDEGGDWNRAIEFATTLPEDLQGTFLLFARAAYDKAPCPPDGEVARIMGSRSPGRGKRLVQYMEQRGIVVSRAGLRNHRIIALPDLGWETAPGDPNAWVEPSEAAAAE